MYNPLTDAINEARETYEVLADYTNEQIAAEFNRARRATSTLPWTTEAMTAYTRASRIGETFQIVGGRQGKKRLYAALTDINKARLANIKDQHRIRTNNATLNALEAACFKGADEEAA